MEKHQLTPLTQRIKDFNKGRIPDMLRVKYEAMTENVFRFFRATNFIFYQDIFRQPAFHAAPLVWICGDLHLENYGTFKGNNRLVYFDMNDFDEALLAPASLELVRMLCSIFIAFDSLKIERDKARHMAAVFLKAYSDTLIKGKAIYIEPRTAKGIVRKFLIAVSRRKQREILQKRTVQKKDKLAIFMKHPRHFDIKPVLKKQLTSHVDEWLKNNSDSPNNYKVKDVAFRLAGTSSLGLKRYLFLLKSINQQDKYLLVEMKQATPSCLEKELQALQPKWNTESERIITIQQRMQNISPALLSYTTFRDEDYIIQEMQPTKDSFNFKLIRDQYRDIYRVIEDMGILTASAQIRSSGWQGAAVVDKLSDYGAADKWQTQLIDYASGYVAVVQANYHEFCDAYKKGILSGK